MRYSLPMHWRLSRIARRKTLSRKMTERPDYEHIRLSIALKLRPVLVPLGHYQQACEELDTAEQIANRLGTQASRIEVQISKSYLFSTHGRLTEAIDYAQKASADADKNAQASYEAKLAEAQARSLMGDWQGTVSLLTPTLPFWEENRQERFGHTGTRSVWCHGHLSNAYGLNGQLDKALVSRRTRTRNRQ